MLLNISRNEVERARLESEYKGKLDLQTKLVDAKREGVEQTARNALAKGYALELIHDITGLDIQTIKTLQAQ